MSTFDSWIIHFNCSFCFLFLLSLFFFGGTICNTDAECSKIGTAVHIQNIVERIFASPSKSQCLCGLPVCAEDTAPAGVQDKGILQLWQWQAISLLDLPVVKVGEPEHLELNAATTVGNTNSERLRNGYQTFALQLWSHILPKGLKRVM